VVVQDYNTSYAGGIAEVWSEATLGKKYKNLLEK
jgi:hypothetical protein